MSSGWLTTKKRGRDDDLIERDRRKALAARKKTVQANKVKKVVSRVSRSDDDNDDDDSLDDFIVESDEELSEAEESAESEEDEDMETFLKIPSTKRRVSKPPPSMELKTKASRSKPSNLSSQFARKPQKITCHKPEVVDLAASSEDDSSDGELEITHVEKPNASRFFVHQQKSSHASARLGSNVNKSSRSQTGVVKPDPFVSEIKDVDESDSDDSVLGNSTNVKKSMPSAVNEKPHKLTCAAHGDRTLLKTKGLDESDSDDSVLGYGMAAKKSMPTTNNNKRNNKDSFESDSDISLSAQKKAGPTKNVNLTHALDSDSDDDDQSRPALTGRLRKKILAVANDSKKIVNMKGSKKPKYSAKTFQDEDEDEDEAIAIALAMSRSENEKSSGGLIDDESVVDMLDESSEEERDDEQDDYVDPAAKEATSILEQANSLSAQIIETLSSWSNSSDGNAATMGLITNGALSLSTMTHAQNSKDHKWISAEVMSSICPNITLSEYQLIGVNWMALLNGMKCKVNGSRGHSNVNGILADEMGLGKTAQTITFLSWLNSDHSPRSKLGEEGRKPHLVVAPASVLSNWEREFQNFAPQLYVIKYHGSMAERQELQEKLRLYLPGRKRVIGMEPLDVILAPITLFQKEKSDDRSFLRKFRYDYLVVDEAHQLKNAKGTRYKSLDKFTTDHRLLLTGTPVQNSPKELLSLLCFLMPLFSRKASVSYDEDSQNDGGESMLEHFVSIKGGKGGSDEAAYDKLKQLFSPFVLRRRKVDVLSQVMPPKRHEVELVDLDPTARTVYDSLLSNHIKSKRQGGTASKDHLFTQLRKAAHHPLLLRTRYLSASEKEHLTTYFHRYGAFRGEACTKEKVAEELEKFNDFEIHLSALQLIDENEHRRSDLDRYVLAENDLFCSSKFIRLQTLLPGLVSDGHRILIFSVWTSCLDLLSCLLETLDLKYLRMEGSTPVNERQDLIDEFNRSTDIPIFLLSTKACGLGINLTAADTCIFHDLDFNPTNDLQAEDRCHRIGQKKPVTVIRLVSRSTVDEDIYNLQQRKAKMSNAIMATNGENDSKEMAKEKNAVLQNAVDRFMQSPQAKSGKENAINNCDRDEI